MSNPERISAHVRTVEKLNADLFEKHDLSNLEAYLTADCVQYEPGQEPVRGPDGTRSYFEKSYDLFPDLSMTLENRVVDADCVVERFTMRGTMEGDMTVGDTVVEATGETYEWEGFVEFRMEDDRISEIHVVSDELGMMQELGLIGGTDPIHG